MEAQNLAIQVHGLQKSFGKLQVLQGVDFDVARGSIFAGFLRFCFFINFFQPT